MSTNKVYGDRPNTIRLKELPTRWDYDDTAFAAGIPEDFPIDQSKHSLFGASKAAADVMVQEYGRYFGLKTCCLRGGCLTGPNHSGVELHGFLSYLVKCDLEGRTYKIFGYKGKQVRDNIHSHDVARFIEAFWEDPRCGEVYNLGGGRENSCSILEAFDRIAAISGKKVSYEYVDKNREGDHICYISDLWRKMRQHYPGLGHHQVAGRHLWRNLPELAVPARRPECFLMRIFTCVRHSNDPKQFSTGALWSGNFSPALRRLGHELVESQVDLLPASRFMERADQFAADQPLHPRRHHRADPGRGKDRARRSTGGPVLELLL